MECVDPWSSSSGSSIRINGLLVARLTLFRRLPEDFGHAKNSSLRFVFMCMSFRAYRRDVNPFETDINGRLFSIDVSIDWPSNRNVQTKVSDTQKVTQRTLLRQRSVNTFLTK